MMGCRDGASVLWPAKAEVRLLPASASLLQESRRPAIAIMGAENSKPSSEVKQHVFSPYVPVCRLNGGPPVL